MFDKLIGKKVSVRVPFCGGNAVYYAPPLTHTGVLLSVEDNFLILDIPKVKNVEKKHYVYINKNYISTIDVDESN